MVDSEWEEKKQRFLFGLLTELNLQISQQASLEQFLVSWTISVWMRRKQRTKVTFLVHKGP